MPTRSALSGEVSNMTTGPVLPRASRLSTTPPSAASGCVEANAAAPHRHASSASVSTKTMSLRGAGPAVSARATSTIAAVPVPSSLPPGPT